MGNNNEFNRFENKITRLFDDFLNDVGLARTHSGAKVRGNDGKATNWTPALDIKENDGEYVIIVDVPGVKKEDIDIDFQHSVLNIAGRNYNDPSTTTTAQEINVTHDKNSTEPQHQGQNYQQSPQYQGQNYQQSSQSQQSSQPQQPQQPQQYQQQQQQQPQQPQQYQQQPQEKQPQQYQQQPQENQQPQSQEYQHLKNRHKFQRNDGGSNEKFHVQERPYGQFNRSIQLPNNIKAEDDFHASLENGVLRIRVPKNNERPKKKITIS